MIDHLMTNNYLIRQFFVVFYSLEKAPVAQLDRVPGFEPGGREFESLRARQDYLN